MPFRMPVSCAASERWRSRPSSPQPSSRRGDLPRIGLADGGEVGGVDDAALEEGQFVVKFEAVDVEGVFRRADPAQRVLGKQALIGEVVDGQDGRDLDCVPGEIGRHQRGLPVIGVDQVGCPVFVQLACRELGGGRGKSAEADVVVRPVPAFGVAIGIAGAIVELWAQQHIDRQAIPGRCPPQFAGRHFAQRRTMADDLKMRELLDEVRDSPAA